MSRRTSNLTRSGAVLTWEKLLQSAVSAAPPRGTGLELSVSERASLNGKFEASGTAFFGAGLPGMQGPEGPDGFPASLMRVFAMYHHIKKLMYTVNVGTPDPAFGKMLLEQFGGVNGELAAAMQYTIQGWNCEDAPRRDLLMDIGTEELSHLEVVGALIRMHLKPMKSDRVAAETDPLVTIAYGGGVSLCNSAGTSWTADYLKITGDLSVDLRNNIAAEARAKIVYDRLIGFTDDPGSQEALQFLMTREITHMRAFSAALESMEKPIFSIGTIAPTPTLVDEYYNASTGDGEVGKDHVGPWNQGNGLHIVNSKGAGGEGLNVKPYRPQKGSEKTSPHDSSPVGAARSTRDSKAA